MATQYRIYKNDGAGGPVDYGTIVATTSSLTYQPSALGLSSDNIFAVRTYDTVSTLEDKNTDARVRITVDGSGNDVTNRPKAPSGLTARATAAGGCKVEWAYDPNGQLGAPTSFKVWLTSGGSVNYAAAPAATVTYAAGTPVFVASLTGLSDGVAYSVGVRATNASGDETNTVSVSVTGDSTAPNAPTSISSTVVF